MLFFRLDFPAQQSVSGGERNATMNDQVVDAAINMQLRQIRLRLEQANGIAVAAEACATAGNIRKAVEIILDAEQPLYEVTTLLNAASLINRIRQDG